MGGPDMLEVHHDHIVHVPVEVPVPVPVRMPPERHVYRTMEKKRVARSPPPPMVLHMQHVSDYTPAEPVHSVIVEVPVEVPVPIDVPVEVQLPVEVQVPVEVPVDVEVPVEKIVEVEKIVHVQVPVYQQQPQQMMMQPMMRPQPQPQPQMMHPPPRSISPPRQMRLPEYQSVSPRLMRSISPGGMRGRGGPLVHERLQEGYGKSASAASPPAAVRSPIYAPSSPPGLGMTSTYGNRYVESTQAQQFNGLQNPAAAASNARQASLSPRFVYNPAAGYRTTSSIASDKSVSPTKASNTEYCRVQDRIHF